MVRKLFTRTKKVVLLSTASAFTLLAASNAYTSESSYILNGASQQTINNLVQQVGGEVIHNFDVGSGVSVNLTETQLEELKQKNPLIRFSSSDDNELAGFVWDRRTTKGERVAGFVWDRRTTKGERIAGFVWDRRTTKGERIAGFVWDRRTTKGERIAGFVWDRRTTKGERIA